MHKKFSGKKIEPRIGSDKKWWHFFKKSKVKPTREIEIQHHVNFDYYDNNDSQYYANKKFTDKDDNNHFRYNLKLILY